MSASPDALEARLAELEQTVRQMQALSKGDPGRDGKDGRDGRDGKSINSARVLSVLRSVNASSIGRSPTFTFDPHITVQPADVSFKAPDINVAAPTVHIAADNHIDTTAIADAMRGISDTLWKPMRPVYDANGKLIGGERAEAL